MILSINAYLTPEQEKSLEKYRKYLEKSQGKKITQQQAYQIAFAFGLQRVMEREMEEECASI